MLDFSKIWRNNGPVNVVIPHPPLPKTCNLKRMTADTRRIFLAENLFVRNLFQIKQRGAYKVVWHFLSFRLHVGNIRNFTKKY